MENLRLTPPLRLLQWNAAAFLCVSARPCPGPLAQFVVTEEDLVKSCGSEPPEQEEQEEVGGQGGAPLRRLDRNL